MRKWLILLSILLILFPNVSLAQETADYDVIIVRSDIPVEYIIAMPLSARHNIPIIQVSQNYLGEQEYEQLLGYYDNGASRALILGGTENAVSEEIAESIHSMGYSVDRKWGVARESTAAIFATDFWDTSNKVVLLNGNDASSFLMGAKVAMELSCPILLTEAESLSSSTSQALRDLETRTIYVLEQGISDAILDEIVDMGITYTYVKADVDYENIRNGNDSLFHYILLLLGAALGGSSVYLYKRLQRKKISEVPLFVLTEDERKVVGAIEKNNGMIHQDKLPDITNFSRPKVSRIVNDLESKKILHREKYGKTYKVKTAKKFINNE